MGKNRLKFESRLAKYKSECIPIENFRIQKQWNEYSPNKFVFEVLEGMQDDDDPNFNLNDELTLLEQIWLDKLQPFGERGYNPALS